MRDLRFRQFCIPFLLCWLILFPDGVADSQIPLKFSEGNQPVLWYLEIGPRMTGPRELYFDDLVPAFCLYGDGNLIYRNTKWFAAGKWKQVNLSAAEMKAILDEVIKSDMID